MLPDTPFVDTGPRGCGKARKAGGLYAELLLGKHGRPVEDFLLDPPILLSFDAPTRVQMPIWMPTGDRHTLHLIDWIGESHYPNVADFVEEVRHMGLSRLIPPSLLRSEIEHPDTGERVKVIEAFEPASRLITAHARAHIVTIADYPRTWDCPHSNDRHRDTDQMCAGVFWWDVTDGHAMDDAAREFIDDPHIDRRVRRIMPSFDYEAHTAPHDVQPTYAPAMFAAWPVARLALVEGAYGEHDDTATLLTSLQLNVDWKVVPS